MVQRMYENQDCLWSKADLNLANSGEEDHLEILHIGCHPLEEGWDTKQLGYSLYTPAVLPNISLPQPLQNKQLWQYNDMLQMLGA